MEFDNVATTRFFLAWCLLTTTVIALTGHHGTRAGLEAGNAAISWGCFGGECLIAYQQTEMEPMAVLDPEHDALASMLASVPPEAAVNGAKDRNTFGCGRPTRLKPYTPCPPRPNPTPPGSPYYRVPP
ncbi:hypothetical protein ACJRO7_035555 [Eucalyptus globulus]|uniref:Uncharacterized protein n=1 Tax=Eucalyptus globulus TaxID=34317 RepID=A0ABD3J9W0_EUCGL